MKQHYLGVMQTVWSSIDDFLPEYRSEAWKTAEKSQVRSFHAMVKAIDTIEKQDKK
ncbi:hypothetical protein [Persicitalea jodogahamensis]|nr:hypothetical protein [Persicitalea jodogahamensis]